MQGKRVFDEVFWCVPTRNEIFQLNKKPKPDFSNFGFNTTNFVLLQHNLSNCHGIVLRIYEKKITQSIFCPRTQINIKLGNNRYKMMIVY
jgi:hypothetical protein